jgi:hypothetical protein
MDGKRKWMLLFIVFTVAIVLAIVAAVLFIQFDS